MKIISIGDLVTDIYYKNGKLIGVNGGMSSHNIIANISKMGLETSVYGVCGNDIFGEIAIKSLSDLGINIDMIDILTNLKTRCFHISYIEKNGKIEFTSRKRCPFCNQKKWYDESYINPNKILKNIDEKDILVFDNLNEKNQIIINKTKNKKMLDLGQYFELDNYNDTEVIKKLKNKFDIINLNERVLIYIKKRYLLNNIKEVYDLLKPKMLIITKGKKGTDFVFNQIKVSKKLLKPSVEIDSTGAGDAFFAVFISEYVKNNYIIDENFVNATFEKAIKLTGKVVRKFGSRGHIQPLYKIKKIKDICPCQDFKISIRKKIKRCNININNLETRVINAVNSNAYEKLKKIDFSDIKNSIFIGTGGSFAGAKFSAKVINNLYGINTISILPRDVYYRNNNQIDSAFLFTYSGTTNDLFIGSYKIDNNKKYIITKGEVQKIVMSTKILKNNIISYRTNTNKGKERGFLSFEGALAPSSIFLKLYFEKNNINNCIEFIKESFNYWNSYFDNYFKENKNNIEKIFKLGSCFNIFTGDFTESASIDLESKIIESGIYNCIIHEKKNFSHGRFINYEHLSEKKNIYFKSKTTSLYEKVLLNYLKKDYNLIIESRYDGILSEYDLLVASQYLIYYISNFFNIDVSKPLYSNDAMKIYFYKGDL